MSQKSTEKTWRKNAHNLKINWRVISSNQILLQLYNKSSISKLTFYAAFRIRIQGSSGSGSRGLKKGNFFKNNPNIILIFSDFYNILLYLSINFFW